MSGTHSPQNPHFGDQTPRLIAIGNFDGVHLGHQSLVRTVVGEAHKLGYRPAVLTFDPPPSEVLGRGALPRLTRLTEKRRLLRHVSDELEVLVQRFDLELAAMTPEAFARELLVGTFSARRVIVGANFRFGRGRTGTLETLQEVGARLGFSAAALPLLNSANAPISSSRIRRLIANGEVMPAAALLGRRYQLQGQVIAGAALGRTLGFPTANLSEVAEMLPGDGVYVCLARSLSEDERARDASWWPAIANVGVRPTLGSDATLGPTVEVHVLEHVGDLYGQTLQVQWVQRVRAERRFASVDELRRQIALDVAEAKRVLASIGYGSVA